MSKSHTELQCYRRCPREHYYRYALYREPIISPEALAIGKRFDKAAKAAMQGKPVDYALLKPAERALVKAYAERWRGTITIEQVDVPFRVRMGAVDVVGELDAIGFLHEKKRRVILELKTTSKDISIGSDYWRTISQVDPQATIYLKAADTLGLSEPFLLWDAARKPALKHGKKETEAEFENRVMEDIAENLDYYFQRAEIVRSEEEHESSIRDMNGTVHLMDVTRMLGRAPRNVDACFTFHRPCDFLPVCSGSHGIDDPTLYRSKERRVVNEQAVVEEPVKSVSEYVF
jgi:hypothetical protein